jgi:hypothetical protein
MRYLGPTPAVAIRSSLFCVSALGAGATHCCCGLHNFGLPIRVRQLDKQSHRDAERIPLLAA